MSPRPPSPPPADADPAPPRPAPARAEGDAEGETASPAERFDMRANFEGLIQLLARNLYPEPDVFIRELIQNGHDSIRLRQERDPAAQGQISVDVRPRESVIVFTDNGLGMDRDDIVQFLSVIGSTGTGTARRHLEDADSAAAFSLIGQFGIGMLSAFVVADRVTVHTRKLGAEEAFTWVNEGRAECVLTRGDREAPGTEIVVSVGQSHAYMLEVRRVREAIVRYCDFLPFPIFVNGQGPVNSVVAPWDRPGWPTEEEREAAYRDFVRRRYPDIALDVIPVELEEPVRARGALYISDRRLPDLNTAGVVDIFVRRMFVREADTELLPDWAKFVRGVIECPDLQPTAARDNVRRDGWAYTTLRQRLGDLIVERLLHLAEARPKRFREINQWHHYHLKGMAVFHRDFFERVGGLLLFETNRGLMSLSEAFRANAEVGDPAEDAEPWRRSVPEWSGQGSDRPTGHEDGGSDVGRGPVYFFSSPGAAPQFFRLADARGWVVVDASHVFEEELLGMYARASSSLSRLVPLDTSDDEALFRPPSPGAEGDSRRLERDVEYALREAGLSHIGVQVCRFAPATLPAIVLLSPDSEADLQLATLVRQPWFAETLGEVTQEVLNQRARRQLRLRLNEDNPLVRSLLDQGDGDRSASAVLLGLFLSAALNTKNLLTDDTVEILHGSLLELLGRTVAANPPIRGVDSRGEGGSR